MPRIVTGFTVYRSFGTLLNVENRQRKTIKKLLRALLILLVSIFLLPFLLALLLLLPPVQNFIVQKAVDWGSETLKTELSLGGVYLEPFRTIRLDGILVRDQQRDTLLYVDVLKVDITRFDLDSNHFVLDKVELQRPYFNLYIAEQDTVSNLQFILDALQPKGPDTTETVFGVECDDVIIDRLRFDYDDFRVPEQGGQTVDFSHLGVRSLSGRFSDVSYKDSIQATVNGLHFTEKSGFILRFLHSKVVVADQHITCEDLQMVTNLSVLEGSYAMHYDDFSSFGDFFEAVTIKADLFNTRIDFYDIGFFSENTRNMLTPIEFQGRAWGTLKDLRTEIDSLHFADAGFLIGSLRLRGLPDVDAFNIDADIARLIVRASDIERLRIPTGDGLQQLQLPAEIHRLGRIEFVGDLRGFLDDFVAFGDLSTDLGAIDADINIKTGEVFSYSGALKTSSFQLGQLLANKTFGVAVFDIKANGSGLDLKKGKITATGRIARFDFNGYSYQNITVDGSLIKEVFEGNLSMKDPNANFDFVGQIDLSPTLPAINCVTRVTELHLGPLGLVPEDTFGVISGGITLEMSGLSKEKLHGQLLLRDFRYRSKDRDIYMDSVYLEDRLIDEGHAITLKSDLVTAELSGRINLFDLPTAFMSAFARYVPGLIESSSIADVDTSQYLQYDIVLRDAKELERFIDPQFALQGPLHLSGKLRTRDSYLELDVDSTTWRFGDLLIRGQVAHIRPLNKGLGIDITARELALSKDYFLEGLTISSSVYNDTVESRVSWDNQTTRSDSGTIRLLAYRSQEYPINVELRKLHAKIANATWVSSKTAILRRDSNTLMIRDLDIQSDVGKLVCDGKVSDDKDTELFFDIEGFNLAYLGRFGLVSNDIQGMFNGKVNIYKLKDAFVAETDMDVDSLIVDQFEIGDINGKSRYDSDRKAVDLNLELTYKELRNVRIIGDYFPFRDDDQLDLDIAFNAFRASVIEPFVSNYAQHLEGTISGTVNVTGQISAPRLLGSVTLVDGAAEVDYLKTYYRIPKAVVRIDDDMIFADWVKVVDPKGSEAHLNASIYHDHFKRLNYDLFLQVENFLALNTTISDNQGYYGTANITGDITVTGEPGFTEINVDAFTNKDTKLSIPLDEDGEVGEIDFIRFVQPKDRKKKKTGTMVNLAGEESVLNLDFQLAVNDNAEIQIIFDEKIGDIIKVRGNGDMLMRIDNRGSFNMFGDYTMTGGDYLFTLQNIVNKKFLVQPGSRISWSGDPLGALVDLTAIYNTRAAPINLTASVGDTSEVYRRRMPVDVFLNMDGKLMSPDISFDVNLPSLPETDIANQLLDPRAMSQQGMNEQAFALLLTGSFFAQGSGVSSLGVAGQTTTYEMMSNQFSNWVSQYFDNIDIGVNYRPGDEQAGNQTEVNVSTELFNDKVLVEVNGRVQGNNAATDDANEVTGEFNIEYRINPTLRARVFNEANNYNPANINQSPYTQGVGLFYRKEFDSFLKEFFRKDKPRDIPRK